MLILVMVTLTRFHINISPGFYFQAKVIGRSKHLNRPTVSFFTLKFKKILNKKKLSEKPDEVCSGIGVKYISF